MICWTALTAVACNVIICFVALELFVTSGQSQSLVPLEFCKQYRCTLSGHSTMVVQGYEYWTKQKCLLPFATMVRSVKHQLWNWIVNDVQSFEPERHFIVFFTVMLLFHNFDHSQFIVCNIDRRKECIYTSLSCLDSIRESVWFNLVTSTDTSQCCWKCSACFVHLVISPHPPFPARRHILFILCWQATLSHANIGVCIVFKKGPQGYDETGLWS